MEPHNAVVQREFTRQAEAYAANPSVANPERVERLLRMIDPPAAARVLDVATGPGYVAMGFATRCREVVALDLTEAPLALAQRMSEERGLTNLRFMPGDATHLPFEDASFDVVVCCLALHHMEEPRRVLREMARVCRADGRIAVEDIVASEHPERAAYQNQMEILRDPSHVRALPLSELLRLFAEADLEVEAVHTDSRTQIAERWLANAQTPVDRAAEVRLLLECDEAQDLSGMRPVQRIGQLAFTHHMAVVVGRKLSALEQPTSRSSGS
jgi:ubiquinone/menaquinone biosynthesis C-methylase UbiE